jgi:hypothetical protein
MTKKRMIASITAAFVVCVSCLGSSASAAMYTFVDTIDTWGWLQADAVRFTQSDPLRYTHDLNQEVKFDAGDTVTEAYLELDFTNDASEGDGYKLTGLFKWDNREYATVGFDGVAWVQVASGAEIDDSAYSMVLDIDWLNDDGRLDVTLTVDNSRDSADAWLDHSKLYGTAMTPEIRSNPTPAVVPVPGALLLGMLGLATTRKLRRFF